jgi:hypothetical protein
MVNHSGELRMIICQTDHPEGSGKRRSDVPVRFSIVLHQDRSDKISAYSKIMIPVAKYEHKMNRHSPP